MPKLGIGKTDRMRKKYNLELSVSIGSSVNSQMSLSSATGCCDNNKDEEKSCCGGGGCSNNKNS